MLLAAATVATAGLSGARTTAALDPAGTQADQVCDATADYLLGMEDYGTAIATHLQIVAADPANALAHYHLGFAYGMTGDRDREITEYRRAAALGLRQWDLYLNLGRALLEIGDLNDASAVLNAAVALAPDRPQPHFNLGLAYERRGMFAVALDELRTSLRIDPRQPDARNMIGLIYAEQHDYSHARQVWSDLARTEPDFEPARLNLAILDRVAQRATGDTLSNRNALRTAFVPQ